MSRFQTSTLTTASVAAGAALAVDITVGPSLFNIIQLLAVQNAGTSLSRFEIYNTAAAATAAAVANSDLSTPNPNRVYGTDPVAGNIYDPMEWRNAQSPIAGNYAFIEPYEDLDGAGKLHVVVFNRDVVSKTYTQTVVYEETPLMSSAGAVTFRGGATFGGNTTINGTLTVTGLIVASGGIDIGGFTPNSMLYGGPSGAITDTPAAINGQLMIGGTSVAPALATITGTANQVVVTNGVNSITLSLPQSIATSSSPTFAALTLTAQLTVPNGGTGQIAFTANGVLYGNTSSAILTTAQGVAGTVLHGNGGVPTFAAVTLTADVTGLLPLANGGTAANLTASNGGVVYSGATAFAVLAGTATAGQILRSGSTAAPTWSTATFPATATATGTILRADGTNWTATTATFADTYAVSTVLYASASNVVSGLATANNAVFVTSNTGVPSIAAVGSSLSVASSVLNTIQGIRTVDSPTFASLTLTAALTVPNGGTGVATLTSNGVLYGNTTGVVQVTTQGPTNSVLTANAGAPSFSATPTVTTLTTTGLLTAGNGLTVTTGTLLMGTSQAINATSSLNLQIGGVNGLTLVSSATIQLSSGNTGTATLILGPSVPSANGSGAIEFINSSTVKNWLIGSNFQVANSLVFIPSTVTGGSTFTTPVMTLDSTGALVTSSSVTAVGTSIFQRAVSGATGSIQLVPTSGITAGSDILSFNINASAYSQLNLVGVNVTTYTGSSPTLALTINSTQQATFAGQIIPSMAGLFLNANGSTTGIAYQAITNTGGTLWIGNASSTGTGFLGGSLTNYSSVILTNTNTPLVIGTNNLTAIKINTSQQSVYQVGSVSLPSIVGTGYETTGLYWTSGPVFNVAISGFRAFYIDSGINAYLNGILRLVNPGGNMLNFAPSTGTNGAYATYGNTANAGAVIGVSNHAGNDPFPGTIADALVVGNSTSFPIQLFTNNTLAATISTAQAWRLPAYGSGLAQFDGSGNITSVVSPALTLVNSAAPQTTYTGSVSGTAVWSMPFQGSSYKRFIIYYSALHDIGGTITFPVAFTKQPTIYGDTAATGITTANTTTLTIAVTAATSGFAIVEGY